MRDADVIEIAYHRRLSGSRSKKGRRVLRSGETLVYARLAVIQSIDWKCAAIVTTSDRRSATGCISNDS